MTIVNLSIPSYRMESVIKTVSKLNKIAIKSNSPTISMSTIGTVVKEIELSTKKINVEFTNIELNLEGDIGYNGYEFIAKLDFSLNTPIISVLPNKSIPEQYYNCKPSCDHCNTNRPRNNTYILRNIESGKYIQVGSSCLAQFLMINPETWITLYTMLFIEDTADDYEESFTGGRMPQLYSVEELVTVGMFYVKYNGYISRAKALENPNLDTTSGLVSSTIFDPEYPQFMRENKELFDSFSGKVNTIIEYCSNMEAINEYTHNLKTLANKGYVGYRHFGFVVSMIPFWTKIHEVIEAKVQLNNTYYGKVSDKIQVELTIKAIIPLQSQYGYSAMYIMRNNENQTFTWVTQKEIGEVNSVVTLKGTIKDHKEYKGICNTVITRCKLV